MTYSTNKIAIRMQFNSQNTEGKNKMSERKKFD